MKPYLHAIWREATRSPRLVFSFVVALPLVIVASMWSFVDGDGSWQAAAVGVTADGSELLGG